MPPSTSNGLDPQIVNLAQAIRQQESGGDPTKSGASGEYGAYQWEPSTWTTDAAAAGVNVPLKSATLQQQNEVAYKTLASWKQQHPDWNVGNFASAWNAGMGEPNAYTGTFSTGKPSTGVNSDGVKYDVPAYAQAVAKYYQQYKAQNGGQTQQTPNQLPGLGALSPDAQTQQQTTDLAALNANPDPTQAPKQSGGLLGSILNGGLNVLNTAEKPFLQLGALPFQALAKALGQGDPYAQSIGEGAFGTSATPGAKIDPLANSLGGVAEQEAGNAAQVGSYFVPGGEGLLPTIASAAGAGLLQGAGSAMSQGKGAADVATQGVEGLGTGAATAGVLHGAGGLIGKIGDSLTGASTDKAIQALKDAYGSALNLNASERGFESRSGKDLAQVLMDNQAPLSSIESGGHTTLDANAAIDKLQAVLDPLNEQANKIISTPELNSKSQNYIPVSQIENAVVSKLKGMSIDPLSKSTSIENVGKLFDAARAEYGDVLSPQVAEKLKTSLANTAFNKALTTSDALQGNVNYLASNEMRKAIEGAVSGTPEGEQYGALNKQRSDLIDAIKRLSKLNETRIVKGGRLGKTAGGILGAITGASSSLGPLGVLGGDFFGTKAAEFLNNPATKIAIANARLGVSKAAPKLLGKAAQPLGNAANGIGGALKNSARPGGLLADLLLNSQQSR